MLFGKEHVERYEATGGEVLLDGRQVEGQQHPAFNPAHVAQYGKQLGVKYFLTGKVSTSDERTDDARRVQYMFYLQVIETATSAIRWQNRAYVTKLVH